MVEEVHIKVKRVRDIVRARREGRNLSKLADFSDIEQLRLVTAISELAHHICEYASEGIVHIQLVVKDGKTGIGVTVRDLKSNTTDLLGTAVGQFSTGGAATNNAILNAKRLVDDLKVTTLEGKGMEIQIMKWKS